MNELIERWKVIAKTIHDMEERLKTPEEEKIFSYSYLAEEQLNRLNNTRPDKTKSLEDQEMTEEQKETINYLKQVIETNEL